MGRSIFDTFGHAVGSLFHKGGAFGKDGFFDKIGQSIGHAVTNTVHDVGNIGSKIVKTAEGVVHDLHEDFKSVISLPRDIVKQAPAILQSAGDAVSTAGQGLGKGLFSASPVLLGSMGLTALFLLQRN